MGTRRSTRGGTRSLVARLLIAGVIAVQLMASRGAGAFCRTTACPLPPNWDPNREGSCYPPDFALYCQSLKDLDGRPHPAKPFPLWWRNACVSYDVQQDATPQLPYATVARIVDAAFAKWTSVTCDTGNVSIAARNLGPVACGKVEYNDERSQQGNQHVIVFRNPWPYPSDQVNTLGLTTVTFDVNTGELYDADTEINASIALSIDGSNGNDFESIITHEAGHFLGMAHSVNPDATMYAFYSPTMGTLQIDDTDGICTIYPPGGTRSVDPSVNASGAIREDACDLTPRHGFSPQCSSPSAGCSLAPTRALGAAGREAAPGTGLLLVGAARLRRSRRRRTGRAKDSAHLPMV